MKRKILLRYLEQEGCVFLRERGNHSIYYNPAEKKTSSVPRHNEIADFLAGKICRDLGVKEPRK